jgi:hypothetical protein
LCPSSWLYFYFQLLNLQNQNKIISGHTAAKKGKEKYGYCWKQKRENII